MDRLRDGRREDLRILATTDGLERGQGDAGLAPRHPRRRERCGARPPAIGRDRPVDVLDLAFARVLEDQVEAIAHLLVDAAGDTDPARLGEPFQARRNVHPVALNVVAVDYDVAKVDADAQRDGTLLDRFAAALRHGPLNIGRGPHGIDDTAELCQQAVPHQLKDAPTMRFEPGVDDLGPQRLEPVQRPFLVDAHQTRIADHIRC